MSARGRRARLRTTVTMAVLLGAVWWLGKALGQHRRARQQMGVAPTTFTVRPGGAA